MTDKPIWLAPSILSANFAHLADDVRQVLAAGANVIHFDVMDNHYVPNLTLGPMVCQSLREAGIDAPIDVHLMVSPVDRMIESFAKAGASMISIHSDACDDVESSLKKIKALGCQAGLAISPGVAIDTVQTFLPYLDFILLMTVEPGFGGQSILPNSIGRIQELMVLLQGYPSVRVAVDGGVTLANVGELVAAGADWIVAGSALFASNDIKHACQAFIEAIEKAKTS